MPTYGRFRPYFYMIGRANKISEKAEIDFVYFAANFNIRLAIIQPTKILLVPQKCKINFGALSKLKFLNILDFSLFLSI